MRRWIASGCLFAALVAAGCSGGAGDEDGAEAATTPPKRMRVDVILGERSDSGMTGIAMFIQGRSEVSLQVEVENAPPGEHELQIHTVGDCSAPDASSAGEPWDPTGSAVGRIGTIEVGEDGTGSLSVTSDQWTIGTGADNDILGKAVVVHAGTGDHAGARASCGVIRER